MSFDNYSQDDLRDFADKNRMNKRIKKKDKGILHNIHHSIHINRKVHGKVIINPYEGHWTPEIRAEVIGELTRIRDTYTLRMYRTESQIHDERIVEIGHMNSLGISILSYLKM